jgi:hypothetical protein
MYWCDGFMPVGASQLRTIPDVGAPIFAVASPKTIVFFAFANIGSDPYAVVFISDGSVELVNTQTNVAKQIMIPGTLINPLPTNTGIAQWGNQFIIIVTELVNGYWITDGLILYSAGGIGPTANDLTSGGTGYTSAPGLAAFGGSGSGITLTPLFTPGDNVYDLVVGNPGTGYKAGDFVQLQFSGGGTDTGGILTPNVVNGSIASINIVNGGTGYKISPLTLSFAGGEGGGAAATATVTAGVITGTSVTTGGAFYNNQAAVIIPPGFNNAASATLALMPFGLNGSAVETYQNRVWVSSVSDVPVTESLITFSAPESYTDFSAADGGGSFSSADSFQKVSYIQPRQTNGFLYLVSDSSINYIGGVTTSGEPPTTSFSNQNADPEVGTPWATTISTIGSNLVFANAWGAHVSYGGQVTKISSQLDGFYNTVPINPAFTPSAAKHILYGKAVWVLLYPVIDQYTFAPVNKLLMWDREKKAWWTSQQSVSLTFIAGQEFNSVLSAYGTDGTSLYPLFAVPGDGFTKVVQSKMWTAPGGYLTAKSSGRAWLLAQYDSLTSPALTFLVDTDAGPLFSQSITFAGPATMEGFYVTPPTATGQVGVMLGMTITTNAADVTLISASIDSVPVGYRG